MHHQTNNVKKSKNKDKESKYNEEEDKRGGSKEGRRTIRNRALKNRSRTSQDHSFRKILAEATYKI